MASEVPVGLDLTAYRERYERERPTIEDQTDAVEWHVALGQVAWDLTYLEQIVLNMRWGLSDNTPRTQRYVARQVGVSPSSARQIEGTAMRKLYKALHG